ncbi:putative P-loop containing nucleoside triphosphate hydrolase [Tanacetum coccineum]
MERDTDKKKPENKGGQLVDEVFSWSLSDVLNRNLYKQKVEEIPMTFSNVSNYTKSFIYPLFEETHADLLSKILGVNRAPTAEIVKVKTSKGFKLPKLLLYTILLKRRQGSYVPEAGDLIALTDVRPRCVDDLKRPNKSYLIALVLSMKVNKSVCKLLVLSSKPINSDYNGNDVKYFAVCLINLTTNMRISQALHSELEGNTMNMIKSVLQADSSGGENCAECCISKTGGMSLLKIKEALKNFQLDNSQETAVLSCIAARECRHRNTIKLIWGPPGTGKTKTVGSLLFMLLRMKCRTLTCAPTNIAVLGVTKRLMSLVRDSLVYDTYGLGDIVLFGNGDRMKIDDCKDLSDIFLSLRVNILFDCLAPCSGWKGSSEWMIHFLENPHDQYRSYLIQNLSGDDGENDSNTDDSRNDNENEDEDYTSIDSSSETDNEENLCNEKEESGDPQTHMKKALKLKNWKNIIISTVKGENKGSNNEATNEDRKERSSKNNSGKKKSQESVLTFEEFVMKGFDFLGNHLVNIVEKLYTHMPTSFISVEAAKQMVELVRSLKSLGESLKQTVEMNVGLKEALSGSDDSGTKGYNSLHTCRVSSLKILKYLQETLSFPEFKEEYETKRFCLENACLIFCTASSSINLHTEKTKPLEFLVIDEAAQLKECESLVPLILEGLRHAILVGDEKQLPAMVQSKICEEAEFGRSLFERLVLLGHKKQLLNVQYRMHPSISLFPNREFYNKQILDGPNVKRSTYGKRFLQGNMYGSYSFINVTSAKEELDRSHSTKNTMEVALVAEIIASLFKEAVARKRRVSVGCISPYKAQVNAIQERLGNKYIGSEQYFTVNVRSVDGFQGSEEDVIIISTVRCNAKGSVGFLSNHQRANVALTRARYCLWILGNGSTLMSSGSIWKQLVINAKDRGCFYDASEDKNLAQAAMVAMAEVNQLDILFNTESLLFKEAKWQVKFSDTFMETITRQSDNDIRKEVVSLLIKLSGGSRQPEEDGNTEVNVEGTCSLLEEYKVTKDLCLIWAVDILAENSVCIQVLKIWDVLPATKVKERAKILMENVYGNYSVNMINRCKEKRVDGGLTLPVTWPMNSDADHSWGLANQLAALSLRNHNASSSASSSSGVLVTGIPTGMVIQDLMEEEVDGKRNVSISSTTKFEEIEDGVLEFYLCVLCLADRFGVTCLLVKT